MSRQLGVTDEKLAALHEYDEVAVFAEVEKLVLRYATAMTKTPVDVHDADFDALRVYFNDKQLVELTSCIAWENHRARFDHAFGLEAENFAEGSACALPVTASQQNRAQTFET